jgi:hypothetical protein
MRKSLFSAAAVAPLLLLAVCGPAAADPVSITDDLTQGIKTSTYNSGVPADLELSSQGSIDIDSGVAVTIDSNNTFKNSGTITVDAGDADNSNNATGILALGGHTGGITNSGTINITEDYEAEDTNGDGVPDGAWAEGSGRYGIRVTGPGAFTGDVNNEGGNINVEGNNSFGISVESQLVGDLKSTGQVNITGKNSVGIAESGGVTGDVFLAGNSITANGEGAKGVDLSGDIGGSLSIYNSISATGYRITSRPQNPDDIEGLDPSNLVQGGSAVDIRGSVAHGIFLGGPPADTTPDDDTDDDDDDDGDGIADNAEGQANIAVFGSAPAVHIGDAGKNVHVGVFGSGQNNFGLVVRGNVTSQGVYDDVASNGIQIGSAGGGTTTIDGGVRIVGVVSTSSHEADATSLHLMAGASTPLLQVEGQINSSAATTGTDRATAVLIDAGGSLTSLHNTGSISAVGGGTDSSAFAVQDLSGTLSDVVNQAAVAVALKRSNANDTNTGRAVAFDLSHNTSGINFTQLANPDIEDSSPIIAGDILLGTGDDTVKFLAGNVLGALDFNAGGGSLLIDNEAVYSGALTASGTLSSVNVANGSLVDTSATTIRTGSLNVGAGSLLVFSADPKNNTSTLFDVSGNATFAEGSKLGVNLLSLPTGSQSFTVVRAGQLTEGNADDSTLLTQTPFLIVANAHTDTATDTMTIDIRRRTAEEAGLNRAEAAAYDAVYSDLSVDPGIQRAFLAQQDQKGLLGLYDQMLPDHAGGVLRALSWAQEAAQNAAAHAPEGDQTSNGPTRGWTQEIVMSEDKNRSDASAYRILGFGAVAGLESVSADGSAIGADISFVTGNVSNPDTPGDDLVSISQVGLGVYWREVIGANLHLDAQAGAGYMWANGRREFIYADGAGVVHKLTNSDWNGYSLYGRLGAYYDLTSGRFYLRPQAHLDYFRLHEAGYTETGGGAGFDLDVDGRTSDVLSGTASFIVGYNFGEGGDVRWRPEVELGWRQVLAGSGGATRAAFVGGGSPFTLPAEELTGGGPLARLGIHVYGRFVDLKLDAGGQFRDGYTDLDLRLMVRIVF